MNPVFYPAFAYGGTVNASYNLCKALVKRGHDVTVYTSDTIDSQNRQSVEYLVHEGIKIHYFKNISNSLAWRRLFINPGSTFSLKENIRKFDLIHLHDIRNFQSIVAAYYAKKYNVPYIIQPHGSLPKIIGKQKLKKIYDILWGNYIIKHASLFLAMTKTEAEQLTEIGIDSSLIKFISNGIDHPGNVLHHGVFRQEIGLEDEPLILYLARFHQIKGADLLVDSFSKILENFPTAKLVMVGPDDGYLNEISKLIDEGHLTDNIILLDPIYDELLKRHAYVDADIYVLPSRYELFPISVLESWSEGTSVIVTDRCGIKDIVREGGIVVPFDEDELANAIEYLLSDHNMRETLGQRGKQLVYGKYSWTKVVEDLENIYQDII